MYIVLLLACVCAVLHPSAAARTPGRKTFADAVAKKLDKMNLPPNDSSKSAGWSAVEALQAHKEKKEAHSGNSKPRRSLQEVEEDVLEKAQEKRNPFGMSRKDKFKLLNKRRAGRIVDSSEGGGTEHMDDKDELEQEEQEEEGVAIPALNAEEKINTSPKSKLKLPFHYSIPQQVLNVATIEGWRQTKIYMIMGMFLFIGGVASVSYYRGRNKMLLPGKLM